MSDIIKISWDQLQKYLVCMDDGGIDYFADGLLGKKYFDIKASSLKIWEERLAEYEKDTKDLMSTAENNNLGIQYEKDGNIDKAIEVYENNINIGYPATHAYDRLMVLYRKLNMFEKEIYVINKAISVFSRDSRYDKEVIKWKMRLSKLNKDESHIDSNITPSHIVHPIPSNPTIGSMIRDYKKSVHEFNFYYDMQDNMDTLSYISENSAQCSPSNKKVYFDLMKRFDTIQEKAEIAESHKDLKKAIELYEKLIAEETEDEYPFERLMIIYRKLKWKEQEIEITRKAILYFTDLRKKQKEYCISLAIKYGMYDKAMEYIGQNKKIFYYGGLFVLYNPYNKITKWQERLDKIHFA